MKRTVLILCLSLVMISLALLVTVGHSAGQTSAGSSSPGDYDVLVARIYFDDLQQLQTLADWREPWEVNEVDGYLIVDVTPAEYEQLQQAGFQLEIDNKLTAEINQPRQSLPDQGGGIPGYACYRTVEETFTSAAQLAATYPTLATWSDVGDSWDKVTGGGPDGYDMMVLKLTNSAIPGPKPALYVFGAIHAREYATAELATRFAEYLLGNYNNDADATWLLDYNEIHLALQANPDGRKIAEAGQLWRKNRNDADGCGTTFGVDLNRNFGFYWNSGGSSSDPCSTTFHGSNAESEPETQALESYGLSIFPDQRADPITATAPITTTGIFIDLHAYGQEILWPWGFTNNPPPNHEGIRTLARKWGYLNGYDATQRLYDTSGTTKDFFYGEVGIPSYTIELGTAFFQNCSFFENNIVPQNIPVLLYGAKAARFSYITPAGPDVVNLALNNDVVVSGEPVTITTTIDDTRYNNSIGTEPTQNVIAAEYYIDIPPWITATTPISVSLAAADGTFNNPVEAVQGTIETAALSIDRHTIYVRGQDADGNWGAISAIFLTVNAPTIPQAGFISSSPDILGATTVFTNTSTGGALSYLWDFGDGSPTSMVANPTYMFAAVDIYTVTLTVSNTVGSSVYSATVEIMPPAPQLYLPIMMQADAAKP